MLRWFNHSLQITAHVVQMSMQINSAAIPDVASEQGLRGLDM